MHIHRRNSKLCPLKYPTENTYNYTGTSIGNFDTGPNKMLGPDPKLASKTQNCKIRKLKVEAMSARQRVLRIFHNTAESDTPRLTRFFLRPPKCIEVEFSNGGAFNLSAEFLRIHSPAADGKIRSLGGQKVISGRRHVGIMSAEPGGNYGAMYY